jgi:hypothetical protein
MAAAGFVICLLTAGCGEETASDAPQFLPADALPGVYSGVFPCDGCPGIPTRLWLRADGRFFFEQHYPAEEERDATAIYSFGRWSIGDDSLHVHLDSSGPRRTFSRVGQESLLLQTLSKLEHRLSRDHAAPAFAAVVRMTGLVGVGDGGMEFTECRTGYAMPVDRGGDFTRLRHQYRSIGRPGARVYVEFDGRFSWSGDGAPRAVTIERFITSKAGATCS